MVTELSEGLVDATFILCVPGLPFLLDEPAGRVTEIAERRRPVLAHVSVLVVEDDDDARELLQMTLELAGANVRAVSSVEAARQRLADELPDLILSDIGMPLEDGYSLAAYVRQKITGHIPMLALTAFTTHEDRAKAASFGFDAHLSKPVDAGVLLQTIEYWVRGN